MQVFVKLMADSGAMRYSSLGPAGFKAFTRAFLVVNGTAGKLSHFHSQAFMQLLDDDLDGVDALWNIALEVIHANT